MIQVIALSLALLGSQDRSDPQLAIDGMLANKERFERCLIDQTVAMGATNTESADTVLRAAGAACLEAEMALRSSYETFVGRTEAERLIQRDRTQAGNAGVVALLRVRVNTVAKARN